MKLTITTIAAIALAGMASAGDLTSTNTSISGSSSGVLIEGNEQHRITGSIGAVLGSSNNDVCGRTFLGVPYSGKNCTTREEGKYIANATKLFHSKSGAEKAAGQSMIVNACIHDKTMRTTLEAMGYCR